MSTLDKIKADVNREYKWLVNTKYTIHDVDIAFGHIRSCIDKYAEQEPKVVKTIDFAIDASNGNTNYFVGFRNGLRYAKSLVDGEEPQYESCAEQEPKTGNWEEIVKEHKCYARDDTYTTTEYHCSECGAEPFENEDGFYELSNYCPNCGCRMVEQKTGMMQKELTEGCEKCLYAEETDGSHCYECVKGENKFEPQESEVQKNECKRGCSILPP